MSLTPAVFVTRSFGAECMFVILTVRFIDFRERTVYSYKKTNLLFKQSKKPLNIDSSRLMAEYETKFDDQESS